MERAALRDGEQQQRLKCCRQALVELTTKGGGQKRSKRGVQTKMKIQGEQETVSECAEMLNATNFDERCGFSCNHCVKTCGSTGTVLIRQILIGVSKSVTMQRGN